MLKIVSSLKAVDRFLNQLTDLLFTTGPIPVVNLVIGGEFRLAIQTHISVTDGRNFLICGMKMGYDVGLMLIVSIFFKYALVSQMHRQKCMFPKEVPM